MTKSYEKTKSYSGISLKSVFDALIQSTQLKINWGTETIKQEILGLPMDLYRNGLEQPFS